MDRDQSHCLLTLLNLIEMLFLLSRDFSCATSAVDWLAAAVSNCFTAVPDFISGTGVLSLSCESQTHDSDSIVCSMSPHCHLSCGEVLADFLNDEEMQALAAAACRLCGDASLGRVRA
jgi:hypothetical protein